MNNRALGNVVIVLEEPQNVVNIAGVVRAMKNMGLQQLRLVQPVEFDAWRITGIAHRADDIVEKARILDSIDEAVADCILVLATSARARTAQRNYGSPREWATVLAERAREGPVAVVFGREDRGLSNRTLDRCDGAIVIPTDPDYSSLNLAQACLIIAYELSLAAEDDRLPLPVGKRSEGPASRGELEAMFGALEVGLNTLDFFKARSADTVMRTFRTLLSRASPDLHEVGLVKAMGFEIRNRFERLQSALASDVAGSPILYGDPDARGRGRSAESTPGDRDRDPSGPDEAPGGPDEGPGGSGHGRIAGAGPSNRDGGQKGSEKRGHSMTGTGRRGRD